MNKYIGGSLNRLSKLNPQIQFFLINFFSFLIEWLVFVFVHFHIGNNHFVTIVKGIGDCALFLIVYWFLKPRYKWIILIPIWGASLIFLFNAWYISFWGELIPSTFYRLWRNVNSDLINSVRALVSVSDLCFILIPIGLTIAYIYYYKKRLDKSCHLRKKSTSIAVGISVILFAVSQCAFIISNMKWNRGSVFSPQTFTGVVKERINEDTKSINAYLFSREGLSITFLRSIINIAYDVIEKHTIELNRNDIRNISEYIADVPEIPYIPQFSQNKNKNIIIILVESLNSDIIGKRVGNRSLTPVLDSIINSEGSVSALNMLPQVNEGISNDGQLIANTGLLPLRRGVASFLFGITNNYPGIPKILDRYESVAIFGDNGQTWNQIQAYKSYGFSKIFNLCDYLKSADKIGHDAAMFNFALSKLNKIRCPFLMELMTFSMHVPFREKSVPMKDWLLDSNYSIVEKDYMNMVNYFDSNLGVFLHQLKNLGILDNTVVFIMSDHSQGLVKSASYFKTGDNHTQNTLPMAFIALNTGYTKKIETPTAQVNIYPTILHIMDIRNTKYRGLGRSVLDKNLRTVVSFKGDIIGKGNRSDIERQKRAFLISDSIQRGDYFNKSKIKYY